MKTRINSLLEYARVGTYGAEFDEVDIASVLSEAIANLEVVIEESSAKIEFSDMPVVHGDRQQLVRLFENLIGNAVKFRRETSPVVHISVEARDESWLFSIRDNGIGIDPKYYEKIFVIFQRLHNRDTFSGTGLGLAISKRIMERHGGRIWVESEPGNGSTFFLTLPIT